MSTNSQNQGLPQEPGHTMKRLRTEEATSSLSSMEVLLAVPVEFVFAKVGEKPLLSSIEAQTFLRIALVAQEMDALLRVPERVMLQRHELLHTKEKLDRVSNPYLRTVSVLLSVLHSQTTPVLQQVGSLLSASIRELTTCAMTLRQLAEHNWTVAETIGDDSMLVAEHRRNLGELQDEVCRRIDDLVTMTNDEVAIEQGGSIARDAEMAASASDHATEESGPTNEPISVFCERLFRTQDQPPALCSPTDLTQDPTMTQPNDGQSTSDSTYEANGISDSQMSFKMKSHAAHALASMPFQSIS